MKKTARYYFLLPLSILYGIIVRCRNWLYDVGICPSKEKDTAMLTVGNLTVGGTGKTPHVEYLISHLHEKFNIAVLSRGYKRKTKGYVLADVNSDARQIGDEPFQIHQKFEALPVAVSENRNQGVDKLLEKYKKLDAVILDDAFQHRRINPGLSILLTDYKRLHTRDSMLPGGNLREPAKGSRRADIIIVTKCPPDITPIEMRTIELEVRPSIYHPVYFSSYVYGQLQALFPDEVEKTYTSEKVKKEEASVLLVTGIVNPQMLKEYISGFSDDIHSLEYKDHHNFSKKDLERINKRFNELENADKLIITTEKDAARLIDNKLLPDSLKKYIFVVPISVKILNEKEQLLINKISDYVTENSRNRKSFERFTQDKS